MLSAYSCPTDDLSARRRRLKGPPCEAMLHVETVRGRRSLIDDDAEWVPAAKKTRRSKGISAF